MKFSDFVDKIGKLPVFESEILLPGVSDPGAVKVQISRWVKAGKLIQLKRGIYMLGNAYRKTEAYDLYIAALLKRPSYISLEKAYAEVIAKGKAQSNVHMVSGLAQYIVPIIFELSNATHIFPFDVSRSGRVVLLDGYITSQMKLDGNILPRTKPQKKFLS